MEKIRRKIFLTSIWYNKVHLDYNLHKKRCTRLAQVTIVLLYLQTIRQSPNILYKLYGFHLLLSRYSNDHVMNNHVMNYRNVIRDNPNQQSNGLLRGGMREICIQFNVPNYRIFYSISIALFHFYNHGTYYFVSWRHASQFF